jgi:microcompartment protein CcmL/EutN
MADGSPCLGLLEVGHYVAALVVADKCVKTAGVELIQIESTDSGALCLKLTGSTGAVKAALEAGAALARKIGTHATHAASILPAPAPGLRAVAKPKPVFNPLVGASDCWPAQEEKRKMETNKALGLLETQGLVSLLHATDAMLKTADVTVAGKEKIGGGYVTILVRGDLAAVQAAVDAGRKTVESLGGKLILADVISNPHPELAALLPK